jgi:hypothetical protein
MSRRHLYFVVIDDVIKIDVSPYLEHVGNTSAQLDASNCKFSAGTTLCRPRYVVDERNTSMKRAQDVTTLTFQILSCFEGVFLTTVLTCVWGQKVRESGLYGNAETHLLPCAALQLAYVVVGYLSDWLANSQARRDTARSKRFKSIRFVCHSHECFRMMPSFVGCGDDHCSWTTSQLMQI